MHHVTVRGNNKHSIFFTAGDHLLLNCIIQDVVEKYEWELRAYAHVDNHFHLLVCTPKATLSAGMRDLNGRFARRINCRYDREDHLLRTRYGSELVETEEHALGGARYVDLNAVAHGFCHHPADWEWSSYNALVGDAEPPPFLTTAWLLRHFGRNRRRAQQRYRDFVEDHLDVARAAARRAA